MQSMQIQPKAYLKYECIDLKQHDQGMDKHT